MNIFLGLIARKIKSKLFRRLRMANALIATFFSEQLSSQNEIEVSFKFN